LWCVGDYVAGCNVAGDGAVTVYDDVVYGVYGDAVIVVTRYVDVNVGAVGGVAVSDDSIDGVTVAGVAGVDVAIAVDVAGRVCGCGYCRCGWYGMCCCRCYCCY